MEEWIKKWADMAFDTAKEAISKQEFLPCGIVFFPNGDMGIIPYNVESSFDKDLFVLSAQLIAKSVNADAVAFINEAYASGISVRKDALTEEKAKQIGEDLIDKYGSLKDVPGRVEIILILTTDKYGEVYTKMGEIKREEKEDGIERIWVEDRDPGPMKSGRMVLDAWAKKDETHH